MMKIETDTVVNYVNKNDSLTETCKGVSYYKNAADRYFSEKSTVMFRDVDTFTGVNHPNYFERKRKGELILGPSTRTVSKLRAGGHSFSYTLKPVPTANGAWLGDAYLPQGSLTQNFLGYYPAALAEASLESQATLDDSAMVAAVAGITKPNYSLMEDILTVRQNIGLLQAPLGGLKDAFLNFRKAKTLLVAGKPHLLPDPYRGISLISDLYLGFRFVVTPTVKSLHDLFEGLLTSHDKLQKDVLLRSTGVASSRGTKDLTSKSGSANFWSTSAIDRKSKAIVYYRLIHEVSGWQQVFGLRGKDLPTGIWNCIRLSFMIDRVFNVSNYLTAVSNLTDPNVVLQGGMLVNVSNNFRQYRFTSMDNSSTRTYTGAGDMVTESVLPPRSHCGAPLWERFPLRPFGFRD